MSEKTITHFQALDLLDLVSVDGVKTIEGLWENTSNIDECYGNRRKEISHAQFVYYSSVKQNRHVEDYLQLKTKALLEDMWLLDSE